MGLGSSDLSDQACLQRQETSYSLGMVSLGQMTLRLAMSQALEHVEGEGIRETRNPRVLQPMCWL
jgi:hypothetical protein